MVFLIRNLNKTVLYVAIENKLTDIVKLLLSNENLDVNALYDFEKKN